MSEQEAEAWVEAKGFEKLPVIGAAKRCGIQWTPWMGDWFTSWSPRNDHNAAEGPWEHWVVLALHVLADPLTAAVSPEAHALVDGFAIPKRYDETARALSYGELRARFEAES